jgi:MFS family permease
MTLYAVDDINDAVETTKAFLWPVDWRRWVKLAVVVFFVGGAGGINANGANLNVPGDASTGGASGAGGSSMPLLSEALELPSAVGAALVAAVVGVLLLVLAFQFVGAVMEFVFVASLRDRAVEIRQYWNEHWRQGARLFGFRLALLLGGVLFIGGLVALVLLPLLGGIPGGFELLLVGGIVLLPVVLILGVGAVVIGGFTTVFVVPIMLEEDRGVIDGWRRFWPTLRGQWKQYATYALVNMGLSIAAGIASTIGTLIAVVVLAIPFGLLGAVAVGLFFIAEPAGIAAGVIVAVLFVLALFAAVALIQVPIKTYLRYYALLVLGDTESDFDLIPEQRAAVRD